MEIRKATMGDFERVLKLYEMARAFMQEHGNPDQWGTHYPPGEMVAADISDGKLYVCTDGETLAAVFFYDQGIEPDYRDIHDGAWLNDAPYGIIHRIAASSKKKGAASFCIRWCCEQSGGNVRIDTHRDNLPMQRLLAKNGFKRCGIICIRDGSERIAYQWEK